jgi:hypothetical protein
MKPILRDASTQEPLDGVELIDTESGKQLGILDAERAMDGLRCRNLTLDTDLYELTMVAGYRLLGKQDQRACFDLYYRQNPDDGAFCVFAGLESVIDYVNNLGIYPDDIEYLARIGIFSREALDQLASGIKFTGDIWAVPEGTVVFPNSAGADFGNHHACAGGASNPDSHKSSQVAHRHQGSTGDRLRNSSSPRRSGGSLWSTGCVYRWLRRDVKRESG